MAGRSIEGSDLRSRRSKSPVDLTRSDLRPSEWRGLARAVPRRVTMPVPGATTAKRERLRLLPLAARGEAVRPTVGAVPFCCASAMSAPSSFIIGLLSLKFIDLLQRTNGRSFRLAEGCFRNPFVSFNAPRPMPIIIACRRGRCGCACGFVGRSC